MVGFISTADMRRRVTLILALLIFVFFADVSYAQISLKGSVRYTGSHETVEDAYLIVKDYTGTQVLSYSVTDLDGQFMLEFNHKTDSLRLEVRGFNNKTLLKTLPYRSQELTLYVDRSDFSLKESYVSVPPVERAIDTLKYNVSSYLDTLVDRTVADVLAKLPGINVKNDGKIQFNGRDITAFNIEGLDLLGGRYGVAVNNLRARDIKRVEIIENYQAKRLMDAFADTDAVAMNLVLSSKAKNSFIFSIVLGGGYKPLMWDDELAVMNFTSKSQMLISYKTNNSGDDLNAETRSFYDGINWDSNLLTARMPPVPEVSTSRYIDNTTHVLSMNHLARIGKNRNVLRTNFLYDADARNNKAYSFRKYYLTEDSPVDIEETLAARSSDKSAELKFRYMINNKNQYLHEQLSFGGKWDDVSSSVSNTSEISEIVRYKNFVAQNNFSVDFRISENSIISINSITDYSYLPSSLNVIGGIFDDSLSGSRQDMTRHRFQTKNKVGIYNILSRRLRLISSLTADLNLYQMDSDLSANALPDSFIGHCDNHLLANYGTLSAMMELRYTSDKLNAEIGVTPTLGLYSITQSDANETSKRNDFLTNARMNTEYKLNGNTTLVLSSTLSNNYGNPSGMYSSFIMTDYRTVNSNWGKISENWRNSNRLTLRYANPFKSVFASVSAEYWWQKADITRGTEFTDFYNSTIVYDIPNVSDGVRVNARFEKRFDDISTLVSIPLGYSVSDLDIYRQNRMMQTRSYSAPIGLSLSTQAFRTLTPDYSISYSRNKMKETAGDTALSFSDLTQNLSLSWTLSNHLICKPQVEHYFQSNASGRKSNMVFADLSLTLKYPKIEYSVDCRNVLGTDEYVQMQYTNYSYSYSESWLRPRSILFKVRFNFGI